MSWNSNEIMTIAAAVIVLVEYLRNEHLHIHTGFTSFLDIFILSQVLQVLS